MLMMLLVRYEEAIAGVFSYLINKIPEAYLSEKSIKYSDLVVMEADIQDVKKTLLDKEVEEIMRQPISEWYKLFESKHKVRYDINSKEFEKFREIYYRRNLIVHNQGVVNDTYRVNTKADVECGEQLRVNKAYLIEALEITRIIIYGTFLGLKKTSDYPQTIQERLFEIAYDHMLASKWRLSEYIYGALMLEKEQSEAEKLCNKVNYWISVKNQERIETIEEEINKLDVTAHSGQFKMAKYALLNEFDEVTNALEEIIGKEIGVHEIEEWPLLIQYRESEAYTKFRSSHSEIFERQDYKPKPEEVEDNEVPESDEI